MWKWLLGTLWIDWFIYFLPHQCESDVFFLKVAAGGIVLQDRVCAELEPHACWMQDHPTYRWTHGHKLSGTDQQDQSSLSTVQVVSYLLNFTITYRFARRQVEVLFPRGTLSTSATGRWSTVSMFPLVAVSTTPPCHLRWNASLTWNFTKFVKNLFFFSRRRCEERMVQDVGQCGR